MPNNIDEFDFTIFSDASKKNTPEKERAQEENRQHKDIFEFRIKIYKWLFWSICGYISLVLILLFAIGIFKEFKLDSTVLIALLSTTSANILGVFYIASKWLFPNKEIQS
jgi:hypothetical protein